VRQEFTDLNRFFFMMAFLEDDEEGGGGSMLPSQAVFALPPSTPSFPTAQPALLADIDDVLSAVYDARMRALEDF
jgi:hypothetical protein